MHQPNRSTGRSRESFGTLLGLFISIPVNLASTWIQWYIVSNGFVFFITSAALLFIFYRLIKKQNLLLFVALLSFVVAVFLNLVSTWILQNILHNSFTLAIVIAIIVSTFIGFTICSWLKLHSLPQIPKQQATFLKSDSYNKTQQEHKLEAQQRHKQAERERKWEEQQHHKQAERERKWEEQQQHKHAERERKWEEQQQRKQAERERRWEEQQRRKQAERERKWEE